MSAPQLKILLCIAVGLVASDGPDGTLYAQNLPFTVTDVAQFNEPWAMAFLPNGRLLVSEKRGALKFYDMDDGIADVTGVPDVSYGGQGGFGDIVLHPEFADNDLLYMSYAEDGGRGTRGAAVARARLVLEDNRHELAELEVIWRQVPKVSGRGHFGHRMAFDTDGYLWISSGERQKFDPSQDMDSNLGKIVRLYDDGSVPADNPLCRSG